MIEEAATEFVWNSPVLEIKVLELELVTKLIKEPSEEEGEGFATMVTFPSRPYNRLQFWSDKERSEEISTRTPQYKQVATEPKLPSFSVPWFQV